MNVYELVKQAYAYGASVALAEVGYQEQDAAVEGEKIASFEMEKVAAEDEGMSPALMALLGAGAGTALGAGGGALAGKLKNVNLLRRALERGASPTNVGMGPSQKALQQGGMSVGEAEQVAARMAPGGLSAAERARNRLFDVLAQPRGPLTPQSTVGGSALLGGAAGAGAGAAGGGLYGGLAE